MKSSNEDIGQIVAVVVQTIGARTACPILGGWAWSSAAGSLLGFVLLFLLGALLVALVAWACRGCGVGQASSRAGVVALIRWRRSRADLRVAVSTQRQNSPPSAGRSSPG